MNPKYKISILIVIVIILLIALITVPNKYKNDVLYSEKYVIEYTTNDFIEKEYIGREEAINKALDVFKKGLDIELKREQLSEDINLYNATGAFEWSITWTEPLGETTYYCNIMASNGEITSIGYSSDKQFYTNENIDIIKDESLKKIIKPLADELGINISKLKIYTKNNIVIMQESYSKAEYKYEFMIDINNKKIIYYQRVNVSNKKSMYDSD